MTDTAASAALLRVMLDYLCMLVNSNVVLVQCHNRGFCLFVFLGKEGERLYPREQKIPLSFLQSAPFKFLCFWMNSLYVENIILTFLLSWSSLFFYFYNTLHLKHFLVFSLHWLGIIEIKLLFSICYNEEITPSFTIKPEVFIM